MPGSTHHQVLIVGGWTTILAEACGYFSIISCEARCQVGIASEARSASHALGSEEVAYASGMM
jgi:hypothetical protein